MSITTYLNPLLFLVIIIVASQNTGCSFSETAETSEIPNLLNVPESDRQAALKQRVCPVCRQYLGEEQPPSKVSVRGEEIFVCSPDCETKLKQKPAYYLNSVKASETE